MSEPLWEDLQRAWQHPPDSRLPPLEKLLKRRTSLIWALTGFDAVASILVFAVVIWVLWNDPTPPEVAIAGFVSLLLVAGWAFVMRIRRGTWRLDVAAPSAMVELSIRRCRASIKLALLNRNAIAIAVVFGLALRAAGITVPGPRFGFESTTLMRLGAVVFYGCWIAAAQWYKRRKQAELGRLLALQEELEA